jgi:hypothetical protein
MDDGKQVLFWTAPKGRGWQDEAAQYVVYRFENGETIDINNPSKIVRLTTDCYYELPDQQGKCTYVVTALDRIQNESSGKKIKVKY